LSLWTPSGEHRVDPTAKDAPAPAASASAPTAPTAPAAPGDPGEPSLEDLTPEQRAQVEEMARQMEETLRRPAGEVVGRQAYAFYELAAIYLSEKPARLDDARTAIDALAAVVERLGDRLGDAAQPLRQAVNQLQMVFVEAANASSAPGAGEAG